MYEVGNRTQRTVTDASSVVTTEDYTYAADANQLTNIDVDEDGVTTDNRQFAYSESGQLLLDINNERTIDIAYNEDDRPEQADIYTTETRTETYQYNPMGQRIAYTSEGDTYHLHYDAQGNRIAETDGSGSVQNEYIYLGALKVAVITSGSAGSRTVGTVSPMEIDIEDDGVLTGDWTASTSVSGYEGGNYLYSHANRVSVIESGNVIDNLDLEASSTSNWNSSVSVSGFVGSNYQYAAKGDGSQQFTWLLSDYTGTYELLVNFTSHGNRASNAPYTIYHVGGSTTVEVNQTTNGGSWVSLGAYDLDENSSIVLSNNADGYVIADGIMVVNELELEYPIANWPITIAESGTYNLYANWTSNSNRASNAVYTVSSGDNHYIVEKNQQVDGGEWQLLGEYTLSSENSNSISLIAGADTDGYVIADAVKVELVEAVQTSELAGMFFIHNDHIGTPKIVTDESQAVVWEVSTKPFGEVDVVTELMEFNARFQGQYADGETGYVYNYYRDYDPSIGRYIQSDPIGLQGGLNTYGYVGGNPINFFDLFGLEVTGGWAKEPSISFTAGLRRNRDTCYDGHLGGCYWSGTDYGLGVEIYMQLRLVVSDWVLVCSDTETCENWTVEGNGFFDYRDITVTNANPVLACGAAKGAGAIKVLPYTCPILPVVDFYSSYSAYKEEMLAAAKAYVERLSPEQRAELCRLKRKLNGGG
ncbi:RHS repeat-associated protein [Reinekea marinisedimentorum]|uniref:RHS repeat-associated protein n=2 Tax=Reinekea marinisedimentorum TaxID=230495 RepID=A0A4R3HU28_9GAMM|nr:RHS repeat-associated protein [Reinekea marinisedimentorum]